MRIHFTSKSNTKQILKSGPCTHEINEKFEDKSFENITFYENK